MRLQKVQDALNKKNITFEYTEEDGCGSHGFHVPWTEIPCMGIRGQRYGVPRPICYAAGRSEDVDGDYEEKISSGDSVLAGYDHT